MTSAFLMVKKSSSCKILCLKRGSCLRPLPHGITGNEYYDATQELLSSSFVDFPLRGELRNEKKHFLYCERFRSVLVVLTNTKTFMEGEIK